MRYLLSSLCTLFFLLDTLGAMKRESVDELFVELKDAICQNQVEDIKCLVSFGGPRDQVLHACFNRRDGDGRTLLEYAILGEHDEMIDILVCLPMTGQIISAGYLFAIECGYAYAIEKLLVKIEMLKAVAYLPPSGGSEWLPVFHPKEVKRLSVVHEEKDGPSGSSDAGD